MRVEQMAVVQQMVHVPGLSVHSALPCSALHAHSRPLGLQAFPLLPTTAHSSRLQQKPLLLMVLRAPQACVAVSLTWVVHGCALDVSLAQQQALVRSPGAVCAVVPWLQHLLVSKMYLIWRTCNARARCLHPQPLGLKLSAAMDAAAICTEAVHGHLVQQSLMRPRVVLEELVLVLEQEVEELVGGMHLLLLRAVWASCVMDVSTRWQTAP